jgi:hypothetical protein
MIGEILTILIALHGPGGNVVYVAPGQVTAIIDSVFPNARSTIMTVSGQNIYVRETPGEVSEKMEQAK